MTVSRKSAFAAALAASLVTAGAASAAPYRREHVIASVVDRLAADLLKVDWNRYSAEVNSK